MKKHIFIIISLYIFSSCSSEDFLDIKPKGVVIPTVVNDYRLLMDQRDIPGFNVDRVVASNAISPGFWATHQGQVHLTDDKPAPETGGIIRNIYTFSDNIYEIDGEDRDMSILYGQIYVCNLVVEEIMDAEGGKLSEKLQIMSEAKLQRAFAYFALVNLYGLHYSSTAETDLAVPLRLSKDIEGVSLTRASVKAIYDFILEEVSPEVIAALPDLVPSAAPGSRPSKAGAYALLATVHLYKGEWEKAREFANMALGLKNTLVDLRFPAVLEALDTYKPEMIWEKGGGGYFINPVSEELVNLYDPFDVRRSLLRPVTEVFPGSVGGGSTIWKEGAIRGYTVPRLMLIRAECNARLGDATAAVDDLNTIRQNVMVDGTHVPITETDAGAVLDLVKLERRLHLISGNVRLFDLKRYNEFDNANISITHIVGGEAFILPANSKNWALPIARKYISLNPEIGPNVRD